MDANLILEDGFANPCCIAWKKNCTKLKQGRHALREAIHLLTKAAEDEKAKRLTLENQLHSLKIDHQNLQPNDISSSQNLNTEVQRLQERILEGDKQISLLKDLFQKEKFRADSEKERADAEKKIAQCQGQNKNNQENRLQLEALKTQLAQLKLNLEETVNQLQIQRLRADSEQKRAESEKNKADEAFNKLRENTKDFNDANKISEEYRVQLEVFKAEILQFKSNFEETKKQLDIEKTRADAEKKRAECEGEKASDALTKLKEDNKLIYLERKNNEEDRIQMEALKTELAQVKLNLEETVKQLEIEKLRANSEQKRAESEKNKADDDSRISEGYRVQLEVLKAEIVQLKSNSEEIQKQLDIEKARADAEKKRADAVKKANVAKWKVKEDARLDQVQTKKFEESKIKLDVLMVEKFQLKNYLEETKNQLEKEKTRADAEKKRAECATKKADEAEKKVNEDARLAEVETKKFEESRIQLDVLMAENSQLKTDLEETKNQLEKEKTRASAEKKRADADNKISESEKKKTIEAERKIKECTRLADVERKKSEEIRVQLEALKMEFIQVKSVLEETRMQLEIEKTRADAEKKRADADNKISESERKRTVEAERKIKECTRLADVERKKSEESRVQLEALKMEFIQVKSVLEETRMQLEIEKTRADAEKKRADADNKISESERKKTIEAERKIKECTRLADVERKKSEESRVQLEALKMEFIQVKSVLEETGMQLEIEKTRADAEKKRADADNKISESERKRTIEAEKKIKESIRLADVERKKSEESRVQLETLNTDFYQVQSVLVETRKQLEKEKMRADAAKKRADADNIICESERKKTIEAENKIKECTRLADVERKKSEESRVQLEALKTECIQVKSVLEETKKQLEKEKMRADAEKKRAESESKKCSEALKKIKEDNRLLDVGKRKSQENRSKLEVLKTGTVGVKENSEENKSQRVNGSVKSRKRKNYGELAVIEGYDQSKVAEIYWKKAIDEKTRADTLTLHLEKGRERILELEREISELEPFKNADQQKSGNANKQPAKEKHLVEQLYQEVDHNKHRIQEMQSVIDNLLSSKNLLKNSEPESAKIKSLRKKVKFEKMMVKHAKQVAELEVGRNNVLQYELGRLKQEILKFSEHLDILDNPAFKSGAGIANQGKVCSLPVKLKHSHEQPHPSNLCLSQEPARLCSTCNVKRSAPFLPLHQGCFSETISGSNSKLECLHRGCNQKMLQSSAINSSSTSFSDRPLVVGSQEDGVFPITTSTNFSESNLNSEQFLTGLKDGLTTSFIHHSHPIATQKNNRDDNTNKKSHVTGEDIRNLTSEGLATCQPHNLSGLSYLEKGSLIPLLQGNLCNEDIRPSKRRKEIPEEHTVRPSTMESDFGKQEPESRSSPPASFGIWESGINDLLLNPELSGSCNGLNLSNIMRLFDLDNEEDERSFCAAMERPLSPSLPVLELKNHNTTDAHGSEGSLDNNFHVGRSTIHGHADRCGSFNVIEAEIDSNKRSKSYFGNSSRQQLEKPDGVIFQNRNLDGFEKADISQTDLRFCRNGECSPQISDIITTAKESHGLKTDVSLTCSSLPRYLIVYPDIKDAASISRICGAVGRYMSHCTMISSSNYVKESLILLARDEGLSSKEKVCTFVTVILERINKDVIMYSGTSIGSDFCQFIDTFSSNLNAVLSDIEMKKMMMDLWDLSDLLNIVEDFLTSRRALLIDDASPNVIKSATLDGNGEILCAQEAPISLLVAGGALLATICTSFDDFGFVCEVSYHIMRAQKFNSWLVLIILHVFARICGPKYFGEEFGLVVNVIRSLVVYLERVGSSYTISSCSPSLVEAPYKQPWSCCNCPFLHDASSTDVVVSLLLKELHNYIINSTERLDNLDQINLVKNGANMFGMDNFKDAQIKTACENFDVFSLLELVACFMSWDWSFDNIVCPALKILESCTMDCFSAALITFLGEVGRLGVEADGYDDAKVEKLRSKISGFLRQSGGMGNSGVVELASATALSGLASVSFEEVVNSDSMIPATASGVRLMSWYLSLSSEQQSSWKMQVFSSPQE